jgi:hypothetical protein
MICISIRNARSLSLVRLAMERGDGRSEIVKMEIGKIAQNVTGGGKSTMTIDELAGERKALWVFKEWLEDKLLAVDIDLACNEQEAEDILNDMEKRLKQ